MFFKGSLVMTTLVALSVFAVLISFSSANSHDVTGRLAYAIFPEYPCKHKPCHHPHKPEYDGEGHHYKHGGEEPWEYPPRPCCKHPVLTGEIDFVEIIEIGVKFPRTRLTGQFNTGFLVDDGDYYYQVDDHPKRPLYFVKVLPPGTAPFQVDLPFNFDYFAGKTLKIFHGNKKIGKSRIIEIK